MWDDILEFVVELAIELIDAKWTADRKKNKKKETVHEEIAEDDFKKL